ncbi:MAG: flippase-like domain-containing protein [Melioribacter sp.]|nr:flippase-like domain-containing protein [Melioribacter sp.]
MTFVKLHNGIIKKITGYFLPVILTIIFLILAFRGINLKESLLLISKTSITWLIIYIVIFYISHFIRALRWKVITNSVKKDTSLLNHFGAVMIGYGVNCVIPRFGEIYRGLFLGKWEKISRTTMIGTVVVERVIDIISFGLASFISVILYSGDLIKKIPWLKPTLIVGFIVISIIILLIVILIKFEKGLSNSLIKILSKVNPVLSKKFSETITTLVEGFSTIKGVKNIFYIIFLTALMFIIYAYNTYVGFLMLNMDEANFVDFKMAWVFMAISAYGTLIPTPGGTGSYHIISIFILSKLYNFNSEISGAYALLTHFIQYVIFVLSTPILIFIINRKRVLKGETRENFVSVFNSNYGDK